MASIDDPDLHSPAEQCVIQPSRLQRSCAAYRHTEVDHVGVTRTPVTPTCVSGRRGAGDGAGLVDLVRDRLLSCRRIGVGVAGTEVRVLLDVLVE